MKLKLTYLFIAILGISILTFAFSLFEKPEPLKDSVEYHHLAENLTHYNIHYSGDLKAETDFRLYSKRPLLYSVIYALGAGLNPVIMQLIQLLMLAILYLLGLSIITSFPKTHGAPVIYSILYISSFSLFISSQFLMADLLLAVILTLIIHVLLRLSYSFSEQHVNRLALLWCVALLTKPIIVPSVFVALGYFVYIKYKHKIWSPSLLLPLILFIALSGINKRETGVFQYSSISSINSLHYNSKLMVAKTHGLDSAESFSTALRVPTTKNEMTQYASSAREISVNSIKKQPFDYLKVHTIGIFKSFIDPGRFELYSFFNQNNPEKSLTAEFFAGNISTLRTILGKKPFLFSAFVCLVFISLIKFGGFLLSFNIREPQTFLLWIVVLYFVVIAGPVGAFRFLLPAIVPFLILSSFGIQRALMAFQKRPKT